MSEKQPAATILPGQGNKPLSSPAHALKHNAVVEETEANVDEGLTAAEAKARLDQYGKNELDEGAGVQPLSILLRQVANAMTLVQCTI